MTQETYIAALDWLGHGFSLLPLYPGTKYILEGYGIENSIRDQSAAVRFFRDDPQRYNLAVVCPPGFFVLDFDDWDFYLRWLKYVKPFDSRLPLTYTELTLGGGVHVFLSGELPSCYLPVPGVEVKRHCVVSPSVVKHGRYEVLCDSRIYAGSMDAALYLVIRPCLQNVSKLVTDIRSDLSPSDGWISKIKLSLSIVELFKKYYPHAKLKQRGKYFNSSCPFHADKNPSFFINSQLNIFGCHACRARGDVINFYALTKHISNAAAVRELMTYVC